MGTAPAPQDAALTAARQRRSADGQPPKGFRLAIRIDSLYLNIWGTPLGSLATDVARALRTQGRSVLHIGGTSWLAIGEAHGCLILDSTHGKLYIAPEPRTDRARAPWVRAQLYAHSLASLGAARAVNALVAWCQHIALVHHVAIRRIDLATDVPQGGPCWEWLVSRRLVTRLTHRGYSGDGFTDLGDVSIPGQVGFGAGARFTGFTAGARGAPHSAHWRVYDKRAHIAQRPALRWIEAVWAAEGIPATAPMWRAEVELGGATWAEHTGTDHPESIEAASAAWAWATGCPPAMAATTRGTEGCLRVVTAEGHSLRRRRPTDPWWSSVQLAGNQLYRGARHPLPSHAQVNQLWAQAAGCAASALALGAVAPTAWTDTVNAQVTALLPSLVPTRKHAHRGAWRDDDTHQA